MTRISRKKRLKPKREPILSKPAGDVLAMICYLAFVGLIWWRFGIPHPN